MNYMDHLLRASFDRDWLSLMLMGTLACIAILRYFFPRRMSELILLPLNDRYFSIEPHQRGYLNPFNTVLLGLQIIAFGLVLSTIMSPYDPRVTAIDIGAFLNAISIVIIYLVSRYALDWCIGHIFNCRETLAIYRFERLSFNHLISIAILIIFMFLYFGRLEIGVLSYIIIGFFLMTTFTSLIFSIRRNYKVVTTNFLYFILYLCALEIAPYAILYRVTMA